MLLQGVVSFEEVSEALEQLGFPPRMRRTFRDRFEDWRRLFALRPRITMPELSLVTGLEETQIGVRLLEFGVASEGDLLVAPSGGLQRPAAQLAAP